MKRPITFALLLLISNVALAQEKGTIRGKVTSAGTGETLIGANVLIAGTNKGSATDVDGRYSITGISAGTYDIVCRFVSYRTDTLENVRVEAGSVQEKDFILQSASREIEAVTVEGKQRQDNAAAMMTMKKKSAPMMDGISSDEIAKRGDGNAAAAAKRVTGVSIKDGKYIYIRGLSDRYSKTTLNGAMIPGLDPERNTVQMDLFPSSLLENMQVIKTFTPERPGSFTGGLIDLRTKDFPEKFTLQYSSSVSYSPQVNFRSDFLSEKGGSTDWLGFDDGTRAVPAAVKDEEIPPLFQNNQKLTRQTRSFNKRFVPTRTGSGLDHSHSFSVGDQTRLFGNSLGFVAGLTYSKGYSYYDNGQTGRYKLTGNITPNSELLEQLVLKDEQGREKVLGGAILNLSYKFSPTHKISYNLMHNQSGTNTARDQTGRIPRDNTDPNYRYHTRTLQYEQRSLTTNQLRGEHLFEELNELKLDWTLSRTISRQEQPDLRYFSNTFILSGGDQPGETQDTTYQINPSEYSVPSRFFRDMEETSTDARLDLEYPIQLNGDGSKLEAGLVHTSKARSFREKRYDYASQNLSYNGNVREYIADEHMDVGSSDGYIYLQDASEERNNYDGKQRVLSFYGMGDVFLHEDLRLIAGLRYEKARIRSSSFDESLEDGKLNDGDLLPSLNGTYAVTPDMNLRFAYTQTLARPSFRELAPYGSFNFAGDYILVGNDELQRTRIDNFDLRWEMFPGIGDLISLSLFAKHFEQPIERVFNPVASNPELNYRNVNNARLGGLEFEFRKGLGSFLSELKGLKAGGNFTYVRSEVDIADDELESIRATRPGHPDTRVMFGQAPWVINAFLNYRNDSLGLNANMGYHVSGKKLVVVMTGGTPNVFQQPTPKLNMNISKTLGDRLSVKFSAGNILNPVDKQTQTLNGDEYIFQSRTMGRTFSLGISYNIE